MQNFAIISWQLASKALKRAGWVGTKDTQLINIQDEDIVQYDAEIDKFINKKLLTKVRQWEPNISYEFEEIVVWDNMLYWVLKDHISHESDIEIDVDEDKIIPFAKDLGYPNVTSLKGVLVPENGDITVSWKAPTAETVISVQGYFSMVEDITKLRRSEILALVTSGDATLFYDKTVQSAENGEATFAFPTRSKGYIKVFTEHLIGEESFYSTGRYITVLNPDTVPPIAPHALTTSLVDGKYAQLNWTQSTDPDLFKLKIVRSAGETLDQPTDGVVIATFSAAVSTFTDTTVAPSSEYKYAVFAFDDAGNGYEHGVEGNWSKSNTATFSFEPVYGFDINTGERIGYTNVEQGDFNRLYPWGAMRRAVTSLDGTINYYLDSADSTKKVGGDIAVLDGTDGELVVEKPAFYYSIANGQVSISRNTFSGGKLSPRTLIGYSQATLEDGASHATSAINSLQPVVDKPLAVFRELMPTGWNILDHETLEALRALFLVEYADFNSQQLIGDGVVATNSPVVAGATLGLGNQSGSLGGSISYRGIENLWGNQFQLIEGIIATDTSYLVATNNFDSYQSENNIGSYVSTGIAPITESGFIDSMNDLLLGQTVTGDSINFVGDHQFSHGASATAIGAFGGRYDEGEKAGLFRNHFGMSLVDQSSDTELVEEFNGVTGTEEATLTLESTFNATENYHETLLDFDVTGDILQVLTIMVGNI